MFGSRFVTDLSLRFYGPDRVVLARRNGSRIGVTGQPASVLAQLVDSADDLAALEALAGAAPPAALADRVRQAVPGRC